jgi:hypothetical protein
MRDHRIATTPGRKVRHRTSDRRPAQRPMNVGTHRPGRRPRTFPLTLPPRTPPREDCRSLRLRAASGTSPGSCFRAAPRCRKTPTNRCRPGNPGTDSAVRLAQRRPIGPLDEPSLYGVPAQPLEQPKFRRSRETDHRKVVRRPSAKLFNQLALYTGRCSLAIARRSACQSPVGGGGSRSPGSGPAVLLMHGGMQASQHFMKLADALSAEFTVYVPDRRGRGLSGPHGDDYSIVREVEDGGHGAGLRVPRLCAPSSRLSNRVVRAAILGCAAGLVLLRSSTSPPMAAMINDPGCPDVASTSFAAASARHAPAGRDRRTPPATARSRSRSSRPPDGRARRGGS